MWYIILSLIILFGASIFLIIQNNLNSLEKVVGILIILFLGILLFAGLAYPILGITTGFYENYSQGERQGYLTKISYKGVIFKTYEAEMQIGTGNMAALQEPFKFSISDVEIANKLTEIIGKKITIKYTQWLVQPYRFGETEYQITEFELIE